MDVLLYIDATGGGIILQVLLSGFVGGAVVFKLLWRQAVNTVLRRKEPEANPQSGEESAPEAVAEPGRSS